MTEQPRDWDKELADIDRVIERSGSGAGGQGGSPAALPPGASLPPSRVAAPVGPSTARGSVARTWFLVVLALLLAVALPIWPYGKECGLQLFFYLGADALTLLAAGAGAVASWGARRGLPHTLALLVMLWAGVLGAREVLPRTGYTAEAKPWLCPATPEPAPPAASPGAGT
jgi:hypothetical protein